MGGPTAAGVGDGRPRPLTLDEELGQVSRALGSNVDRLRVISEKAQAYEAEAREMVAKAEAAQETAKLSARRAAQEYGVPVTLRGGDPFAELRATADDVKADFVFVGASTSARHGFVGSIATRLVGLGRWPVVVVP